MNYRNAKYIDNEGRIDCEIEHPVYGWIPYTLDPNDTDNTVDNSELLALMYEQDDVVAITQEELDSQLAEEIRYQRDLKLATEVDPLVMNSLRWNDLTAKEQQAISDYRKALLDLPQQAGFPNDITWPVKP